MKKLLIITALMCCYGLGYSIDNYSKTLVHIDTDIAKPDRNEVFTDTDFNTSFTRITDAVADAGTGEEYVGLTYSRFSPLNCDGTKLLLQRENGWDAAMIYNATTHALIKIVPRTTVRDGVAGKNLVTHESTEPRWSATNPDLIYFIGSYVQGDGMKFFSYNCVTDAVTTVHNFSTNFPTGDHILNNVEGSCSDDGRYWAFMTVSAYNGSVFPMLNYFCYDMQTDSIIGTLTYADYVSAGGTQATLRRANMVDMSPSGDKMVLHLSRCYDGWYTGDIGTIFDGPHAFDKNLSVASAIKVAIDETHSGWGYDANGNELFVSQNNRNDWIEARNVLTGETIDIIYHGDLGWSNGMHFSRMPLLSSCTGWVLVSTYRGDGENNTSWGDDQLFMLELVDKDIQTPRVYRLGHTWNKYNDYRSEGFAAMSQFGDKLWFNAKWWDGDVTECYEMNMPDVFGGTPIDPPDPEPDPESTNYTQDADVLFTLVMDADTNPLTDSSPNELNATKKAATEPLFNSLDIPKNFSSGCVEFDGVDDYIYVSSAIAIGQGDFSAVFWIKPDIEISTDTRFLYLDDEFSISISTKTSIGVE